VAAASAAGVIHSTLELVVDHPHFFPSLQSASLQSPIAAHSFDSAPFLKVLALHLHPLVLSASNSKLVLIQVVHSFLSLSQTAHAGPLALVQFKASTSQATATSTGFPSAQVSFPSAVVAFVQVDPAAQVTPQAVHSFLYATSAAPPVTAAVQALLVGLV
jgi:hypothetical protein